MKLFIRTLMGKTLTLDVTPADTIENVKAMIRDTKGCGISIDNQSLVNPGANGRRLDEDYKTLSDYNI